MALSRKRLPEFIPRPLLDSPQTFPRARVVHKREYLCVNKDSGRKSL